jgi:hypothetical protein
MNLLNQLLAQLLSQLDKLAGWWLDWRTVQLIKSDPEHVEPELVDLQVSKERGLEMVMAHPLIASLAIEAANFLGDHHASNYVQMELQPRLDRGVRPIILTIAYKDGEMPARKAAKFETALRASNALLCVMDSCEPVDLDALKKQVAHNWKILEPK